MTTFINARLDDSIEQGSQGGPQHLTTVMGLSGGGEKRNGEWEFPRVMWNISYGITNREFLIEVLNMFNVCRGRLYGFRFKDWIDYVIGGENTGTPQVIGAGGSSNHDFQAYKTYSVTGIDGSTVYSMVRKITRLVEGTLKVYLDGVLKTETTHYTVNYDTGIIHFLTAPGDGAVVSIWTEFDVAVRFDTDMLNINLIWKGAGSVPPINIIELREGE